MSFELSADTEIARAATASPLPLPVVVPTPAPASELTRIECHTAASPERASLEEFVRNEFRVHFGARVTQFMPELLALRGPSGDLRAVVGCRAAGREPLFLEAYTREPIERVLARHNGFVVARERIVEIGSLACRTASGAVAIVQALVPYLLAAGYSWVVFTGATTVMNVFRYLGLAPEPLCPADPLLLGEARHAWGTYYDHAPQVMAGRIVDGVAAAGGARRRRLAQ